MRSLSPNAPNWWSRVKQTATGFYTRWLHADPLQKLGIKSEAIEAREDFGQLARVEERGSILLLQALPADLQSEAVSVRGLASSALVFLVMSRYQPGGSSEKSMILSFLTQPYLEGQSNIASHHAALRKWDRLYRRGRELGLQSPDPILLVKGLDSLGRIIHSKSPTAAFTVSTFRHRYQLDSAPTETSVLQYCQLLTAELETLSLSGPDSKQQRVAALQYDAPHLETPNKNPKGKGKTGGGKSGSSGQSPLNEDGICKFFMSASGCRYGKSCVHHHSQLTPADKKCFNCGSEGHSMAQCERPSAKPTPKSVPKLPGTGKGEGKGDGKGTPKADPKTPIDGSVKASPAAKKKQPRGRRLGVSDGSSGNLDGSHDQGGDGPLESALKSMCVEGPYLTASLRGIALDEKTGLLDGGATHCLRFGPPGEYEEARPVEVQLASGSTQELRINTVGTLISPNPEIQPIMPMGLLAAELQCDIRWDKDSCEVHHPTMGQLEVSMVKNCPEVEGSLCLELIREIEDKRASAMMRSAREVDQAQEAGLGWDCLGDQGFLSSLDKWVRKHYSGVPDRVMRRLVPEERYEPSDSALNRHTRRKLERGSAFVHMFSGEQRWDHAGAPSIALDLKRGHDLREDPLYFYLLQLARKGHIQYLLGGPPCRTFTPLRARGSGVDGDGGPRIARGREGDTRFGLSDLNPEEWEQVDGDTVLALRLLILADVCAEGLKAKHRQDKSQLEQKLFFGFEHPEDPEEFLQPPAKGGWPSIWTWKEVRDFIARHRLFEASFHQGLLGHCKVKPTRMMLSSGHLWERLHMLKVPKGALWKPTESKWLRQRIRDSSAWAAWAPQLVDYIQQSMREWQKGVAHTEHEDAKRQFRLKQLMILEEGSDEFVPNCCVRRLKGQDMEQFRQHCLNGHRPWRSDCKACLDAMSFTRPHRRLQKSRACCLSIDISGPFWVEKAEDYEVAKPKYMLVGAYTFPVFTSGKLVKEPPAAAIPTLDEAALLEQEGEVDARAAPEVDRGSHESPDPLDEAAKYELHEEVPHARALTAAERKRLEAENKKWEGIMASCKDKDYELVEIPFAVVLPTKSTHAIIGGLNRFYAKLRSLGLPVYRLHSDCAQEFTHPLLRQWANHRSIHVTTTMPESKASNGRAERLIGRLKQQVRALLSHHQLPPSYWPHALRHAAESMQRSSLARLGHVVHPVAPFNSLVRFRSRSWRNTAWGTRATEGRLMAPCHDISRGYVIRVLDKDVVRYYATTLIYRDFQVPESPPDLEATDGLASELRAPRTEVGWPPPVGAGDVQVLDPVSADDSAAGPVAPPIGLESSDVPSSVARRRITSKSTPMVSKTCATLGPVLPVSACKDSSRAFANMSLAELQVHALTLSRATITALNKTRTQELLAAILKQRGRPLVVSVVDDEQSASGFTVPPAGVEQLVRVVVRQCCPKVLHGQVVVTCCDASELQSLLAQYAEQEVHVVLLSTDCPPCELWTPLCKGSVLQGNVAVRPGSQPESMIYGQLLELIPWHGCSLADPASCQLLCPSTSGPAIVCPATMLFLVCSPGRSGVAVTSLPSFPHSHAIPGGDQSADHAPCNGLCGDLHHESASWGESSHAATHCPEPSRYKEGCRISKIERVSSHAATHCPEPSRYKEGCRISKIERVVGDNRGNTETAEDNGKGDFATDFCEKRWFDCIPLPEVEPLDKCFLYGEEGEEQSRALDGLRLATLAAIRDQETAIARELQSGDAEIARLTAECLAEMNHTVSGLEEILCNTADDIPQLYESQGPQNHDISLRAVTPAEGAELLQAKVIPITEVCENIEVWKEAIGEEVASVINKHKAGTFKTDQEVKQLEASGECQVIRVPGKLVAAIKPPRRYKARLVACGNFLHREKTRKSATLDRTDLYCSNLDIFSLRIQLATGVHRGWKAASIDVKTAFLTAPYQAGRSKGPNPKPKIIMVKVPKAVTMAGFAPPNSYIQVDKALYGLQESPHSWSLDRDRKLGQVQWTGANGLDCRFVQCEADGCIWKILDSKHQMRGTLGVYVDDLLFMTAPEELENAILAVRSVWECSETAYAQSSEGMGFCGIQIVQRENEIWIHQEKYVEELHKRYPELRPSAHLPDFRDLSDDEVPTPAGVRSAQKIIGELQWLAGRTRPDIGYCVNRMSRLATKVPGYVQKCGQQVVRYLLGTAQLRIRYGKVHEGHPDFAEALPLTRTPYLLETFCDASFAQQDACSQTGVAVLLCGQLIGWLSLRQPFITLSTAEAEVVSCVEGVALAQALRPLVDELSGRESTWALINDNIACGAILSYPAGSWRSRHLRLRSKALQEMISEEIMSVHHIQGRFMLADLLTKPLAPIRVLELLDFMGFDTKGINLGRNERTTRGCESVSPTVRVIMLSVLVVPAQGQGEDEPQRSWDGFGLLCWCIVVLGMLIVFLLNRWNRGRKLRQLWKTVQALTGHSADTDPGHAGCEEAKGIDDPKTSKACRTPVPISSHVGSNDPETSSACRVPSPLSSHGGSEDTMPSEPSSDSMHHVPISNSTHNAQPGDEISAGGLQMFRVLGYAHILWYLWSLRGSRILEFLGLDMPEMKWLREAARGARFPVASAYAALRPPPLAEPVESADEDTDSGISSDMSSGISETEYPWDPIHELLRTNPMYREQAVENAFQIWLMSERPYSANLREFPFLDALFDIELMAIEVMIEWYHTCTPVSQRSQTPPPPTLGEDSRAYELDKVRSILETFLEERDLIVDQLGLVWSGPRTRSRRRGLHGELHHASSLEGQEEVLPPWLRPLLEVEETTGARSSHEPPPPVDIPAVLPTAFHQFTPNPPGSDFEGSGAMSSHENPNSLSPPSEGTRVDRPAEVGVNTPEPSESGSVGSANWQEHDHHVAQAAFVLFVEGFRFDWEQMSENQQELYHGMVGRYLQNLHNNN